MSPKRPSTRVRRPSLASTSVAARRDAAAVAIERQDPRARMRQDGPAIGAAAEGGVDIGPAVAKRQGLDGLGEEHRYMGLRLAAQIFVLLMRAPIGAASQAS